MAEIRKIIELLSKILSENGFSEVKAEIFRQAKFNKPEATIPMWRLLFESICFCNCRFIDDSIKNIAIDIDDDITEFVKQGLINLGYVSPQLNSLPGNGKQGSRELLLAFGWLFCRKKLIDQFLECNVPLVQQYSDQFHNEILQKNENEKTYCELNPSECLDAFVALNNELRLNLNNRFGLELQHAITNHKIAEETKGFFSENPHRDYLTDFELYLMQNPEELNKYTEQIEKDNKKLEHFLSFKSMESVFWQWMESVLDAKIASGDTVSEEPLPFRPIEAPFVEKCRRNLFTLIDRYSGIISYVEDSLKDDDSNISIKDLDILLESLDKEISEQTIAIKDLKLERKQKPLTSFSQHFILLNEQNNKQKTLNRTPYEDESDINLEIQNLKEMIIKIERKLQHKQKDLLHQLKNMSQNFEHVVVVPPLKPKLMR